MLKCILLYHRIIQDSGECGDVRRRLTRRLFQKQNFGSSYTVTEVLLNRVAICRVPMEMHYSLLHTYRLQPR